MKNTCLSQQSFLWIIQTSIQGPPLLPALWNTPLCTGLSVCLSAPVLRAAWVSHAFTWTGWVLCAPNSIAKSMLPYCVARVFVKTKTWKHSKPSLYKKKKKRTEKGFMNTAKPYSFRLTDCVTGCLSCWGLGLGYILETTGLVWMKCFTGICLWDATWCTRVFLSLQSRHFLCCSRVPDMMQMLFRQLLIYIV